jgi:hypothetical protein
MATKPDAKKLRTEIGVRIVEAIGDDVEVGDALAALRLVSLWEVDPQRKLAARIMRAIGPDVSTADAVTAMQLVITYFSDKATEPPAVTRRDGARK